MTRVARILLALGAAAALAVAQTSCSESQAEALCAKVCECEHCDDHAEELACAELETEAEIADGFGCASAWESWASCVDGQGSCDDDAAEYSTLEGERCTGTVDVGFPCTSDQTCIDVGYPLCVEGSCAFRVCSSSGSWCSQDSECSGSTDACADERQGLADCEAAAANRPLPLGSGFGGES